MEEVLTLSLQLVYRQSGGQEADVESVNCSESTVNIFNLRHDVLRQREVLQSAIRSLICLSEHFGPRGDAEEDDFDLMNDLMSHSAAHSSPKMLRVRVRKKRMKRTEGQWHKVRAEEMEEDHSSHSAEDGRQHAEYEEVDVDDAKMQHFYDDVYAKYRDQHGLG